MYSLYGIIHELDMYSLRMARWLGSTRWKWLPAFPSPSPRTRSASSWQSPTTGRAEVSPATLTQPHYSLMLLSLVSRWDEVQEWKSPCAHSVKETIIPVIVFSWACTLFRYSILTWLQLLWPERIPTWKVKGLLFWYPDSITSLLSNSTNT